jgi:tetratricopeptide (TPR) repeat protein
MEKGRSPRWKVGLICTTLALGTGLVFGRMVWDRHAFVLFDDPGYITLNPQVRDGLSWSLVAWAFNPANQVVGNYHPLTVLSHALDCQLFGIERPWAHHLVNLLIHLASTLLLFAVLRRMTGDDWPSALVAALFAWHPLHVESVAWASERKDVLSAFFWFLAMWFYVDYVRGSKAAYVGVFGALLLGLLAKPMVVTLPLALLLLDYWPLQRLTGADWGTDRFWTTARRLVLEKLPLFALVVVFIPLTLRAQAASGAVTTVESVPMAARVVNALYSYNVYLAKTVWPAGLAVPYPLYARQFTSGALLFGGMGFLMVTYLALSWGRSFPYVTVGWLWYVGTLVPVIGLVQVGYQSHADRYTYIPLIGVFMAIAWGLRDLVRSAPQWRGVVAAGVVGALVVLAVVAYRQVGYWRDTVALFSRAAATHPDDFNSHYALATGFVQRGDYDAALLAVNRSLELNPDRGTSWHCKGYILLQQGKVDEAIAAMDRANEVGPPEAKNLADLGWICLQAGRAGQASTAFRAALEIEPHDFRSLLGLAAIAKDEGRGNEALGLFKAAKEAFPNDAGVSIMISRLLATSPQGSSEVDRNEAVRLSEWVCHNMQTVRPYWLDTLAAAYAAQGRFDEAISTGERAHALALSEKDEVTARLVEQHLGSFRAHEALREELREIPTEKILQFDALISRLRL